MAEVDIEQIIWLHDIEFKRALSDTIKKHFPGESFNAGKVFGDFKNAVERHVGLWIPVDDDCVKVD